LIFEKPSISLKRRLSFETRHVSNGAFRFRVLERDHGSRVDTDDVHFRLGQVGGERERERERARENEREREREYERERERDSEREREREREREQNTHTHAVLGKGKQVTSPHEVT